MEFIIWRTALSIWLNFLKMYLCFYLTQSLLSIIQIQNPKEISWTRNSLEKLGCAIPSIFISTSFLFLDLIVVLILRVDWSGKKENKTIFPYGRPHDIFSTVFSAPITVAFLIVMNLANFSLPEGYCTDFPFQRLLLFISLLKCHILREIITIYLLLLINFSKESIREYYCICLLFLISCFNRIKVP